VDLLTTKRAAAYLGLSVRTVRYWVAKGKLTPTETVGIAWLFSIEELDRFKAIPRKGGRKPRPKD
jgi:excisionase family DNA binding protein